MDGIMQSGCLILMNGLDAIDCLAELGLARSVRVLRSFTTALLNHHIGNAPKVELVKRGNKTLVIHEELLNPSWGF